MKKFIPFCFILFIGCQPEENDSLNVNLDLQNRGAVIGKALINSDEEWVGVSGIDIRLSEERLSEISSSNTYKTTSNSNGEFLIELPAGSYNAFACYTSVVNGNTTWFGDGSVIVPRGSTVDMGEINLVTERAYLCAHF